MPEIKSIQDILDYCENNPIEAEADDIIRWLLKDHGRLQKELEFVHFNLGKDLDFLKEKYRQRIENKL